MTLAPRANFNGPTSFSYTVTSGGVIEMATVNIGVTPVNDAPVNMVPGPQTAAEDTALPISGVSVADVDGDPLTTTLTITNGTASVTHRWRSDDRRQRDEDGDDLSARPRRSTRR